MKATDQFHVGIVADDFERTVGTLTSVLGYEWGPEVGAPIAVTPPTGEAVLELQCAYSVSVPRLEVVRSIPGTLWEPVSGAGIHHVGYWSDDVAADCGEFARHGYVTEATRKGADGELFFAFLRSATGFRVELVTRAARPGLEGCWAAPARPGPPRTRREAIMTTVGIATGAGRGMGLACAERLAGMVDVLLLVDRDEETVTAAADELAGDGAVVEPFVLDITDRDGLARLATRVGELGTLRAVAHAAGISPTMADWRRIVTVDLIGTALLAEVLRPLATAGTALVHFSSMSADFASLNPEPAIDAVLTDPLDEKFLDRLADVAGSAIENTGMAYSLAKRGVRLFVQQEAVRLGPVGARVCSLSPGLIDTPQGRQEAEAHPSMEKMVRQTPLDRKGSR